jgi:hypothetical protein
MENLNKLKMFMINPADPITLTLYVVVWVLVMLWLIKGV